MFEIYCWGQPGVCGTRKQQYAGHSPTEGVKVRGLGVVAFNEKSGGRAGVYGYSVTEEFGDKQVGVCVNS